MWQSKGKSCERDADTTEFGIARKRDHFYLVVANNTIKSNVNYLYLILFLLWDAK